MVVTKPIELTGKYITHLLHNKECPKTGVDNEMEIPSIEYNTEAYLQILRNRYESETGNEITVGEILDSIVKLTFQQIYGFPEAEVPEVPDDDGVYFAVTIPSGSKEEAEYILKTIKKELDYGGWVREGNYNED